MKEIIYSYTNNGINPIRYIQRKNYNNESKKNLNKGFKTLGVSEVTQKKIRTACRVLSYSSEKRKVRDTKGNYIDHLGMFITLTLPYEQINEDAEITKIILGDFLDRCRKLGFLKNYVWRAEKQKNNNIHYHILTDSFCSYSMIYRLWKLALEKLKYVTKYSVKFKNMSFDVYRNLPHNKKLEFSKIAEKYAKGVRENWQNPPCVKVDYCNNVSQVSAYISKYTSKNDDSPNIVKGRVWSCSESVSKAVHIFKKDRDFNEFWYNVGFSMMKRKVLEFDFFSIVDFNYKSLISWFSDTKNYILKKINAVFAPCNYYLRSLGIVPT